MQVRCAGEVFREHMLLVCTWRETGDEVRCVERD